MSGRRIFRMIAWLCFAAITVLSLVSPSLRPVTFVPPSLEHAAIFALAGFAAGLGYPNRPAHHMGMLVVFAAAIELAQFYAPGRHPRLIDFAVDALGGCAGVALAFAITKWREQAANRA